MKNSNEKIESCFWCGGQGHIIKDSKCPFCKGTGKLNYVKWVKSRKKFDIHKEPIIILAG